MANLTEKRKIIHDWIDVAGEEEVDQLLGKILGNEQEAYDLKLTEELLWRRQKHIHGFSKSFTREEVQAKLEALIGKHDA